MLVVEDNPDDAELMLQALRRGGADPVEWLRVDTDASFRAALARDWDAVLADYRLPAFSASAALAVLADAGSDLPCIVVSGAVGDETAAAVMRAGAVDFVAKDRLARLPEALRRSLADAAEHRRRLASETELVEARHRADLLDVDLANLDRSRLTALEMNDTVLQHLVVAQGALQLDDPAAALVAVDDALAGIRRLMSRLLPAEPVPGSLRRGTDGAR